MNVDESVQDLGDDYPALGLSQLELRLREGGEQVASLQVLRDDDALARGLVKLDHLDNEFAILKLVEEPRLPYSIPALLLRQLLKLSRVKVPVLPAPHEEHHREPAPAQLGDEVVILLKRFKRIDGFLN